MRLFKNIFAINILSILLGGETPTYCITQQKTEQEICSVFKISYCQLTPTTS